MKQGTYFLIKGLRVAAVAVIGLTAFSMLGRAVSGINTGRRQEGLEQLEDSIRRAAVTCYANEGVYPDTLDALLQKSGLQVSPDYTVFYDIFAENLMPDITVVDHHE